MNLEKSLIVNFVTLIMYKMILKILTKNYLKESGTSVSFVKPEKIV